MTDKSLMLNGLTIQEAINKCEELTKNTAEAWYFKANKGSIKLACENNNK